MWHFVSVGLLVIAAVLILLAFGQTAVALTVAVLILVFKMVVWLLWWAKLLPDCGQEHPGLDDTACTRWPGHRGFHHSDWRHDVHAAGHTYRRDVWGRNLHDDPVSYAEYGTAIDQQGEATEG